MEQAILYFNYLNDVVKCNGREYKPLILTSSVDQIRAIINFVQLCADKNNATERKLLNFLHRKKLYKNKITPVLIKYRLTIQGLLCCILKLLLQMATFHIVGDQHE